jgi:hypothetical protein
MGTFREISRSNRDEYEDECFCAVQAGTLMMEAVSTSETSGSF